MMKTVAIYTRVSTRHGQTVENQLRQLREIGERLGWNVVAEFSDEGISGAKGREDRPAFDALMRSVTRREVDLVAAWSVDRIGRSLSDLVGFLGELQARNVDIYLHQQGLDTSTPSGRMLFQILGVFAQFEREMIRERVVAGLDRAKASGKRLGRPGLDPTKVRKIEAALRAGQGIRPTARTFMVSTTTVMKIRDAMVASQAA
jgi:DNA invertase Pin-like site-specific DNA recombinase